MSATVRIAQQNDALTMVTMVTYVDDSQFIVQIAFTLETAGNSAITLLSDIVLSLCSEFCSHDNHKVDNMVGQLPTSDTVEYILDLPPPAEEEGSTPDDADADKAKAKASSSATKGGTIWFAIDISSSMACTIDIPDLQGKTVSFHHFVDLQNIAVH